MTWTSDCGTVRLYCGDCLDVLPTLEAGSVDAVVTDPPYGLSFMGKHWDHGIPGEQFWREVIRVAKPGCHLLAFGGTRTYHRLACAIEDAGWEVRDCLGWIYGSGFPKSLDVSKAIDKAAGVEREVVGSKENSFGRKPGGGDAWGEAILGGQASNHLFSITAPATDAAKQWQGWGTALKPAWEPIILARKPLVGTVAANVLEHGTGGLNVDGCRVGDDAGWSYPNGRGGSGWHGRESLSSNLEQPIQATAGRWPANIIHDGGDEVLDVMGEQSRFFYTAKASKADRDEGCEGLIVKDVHRYGAGLGEGIDPNAPARNRNHHPTVKPTDLMRWLVRLVTPPGGTVLDPFTGSGSTGKAARLEGFRFVGIEREAEYHEIARRRIEGELKRFPLFQEIERQQQATLFADDRD